MTAAFELKEERKVPEIGSLARLYRHAGTGAEFVSLINDDENKCFGITFRTPVADSTGVAHILEHCVLCGSRRFPLKDPFIAIAGGSLNTFINAFTGSDRTSYPVASQNTRDLYNLMEVYYDAVFHPLLARETFEEQGWHYEIDEPGGPMCFRGVVFNEMKGDLSSPDSRLFEEVKASLFPDTIYHFDSGGDPEHIPDLTYEQFIAFHRAHYHPSNSLIYIYGNDDPEERLRWLGEKLKEFSVASRAPEPPLQPPFHGPLRFTRPYPASLGREDGAPPKCMVSVNWIVGESADQQLGLDLRFLEQILLGTPAAPLRKALIDSGLGEDLTPSGVVGGFRQLCFVAGLKGVEVSKTGAVEELILTALRRLADEGIDPDTRDAALNTVEFALRENNTGGYPRGLAIMGRAAGGWMYGGDPLVRLGFEAPLQKLKQGVERGGFFEGLIRGRLLENEARTTVALTPDLELDSRITEAESKRLARARAEMGPEGEAAVVKATLRLKERQSMPDSREAIATLPMLRRADLDRKSKIVPVAHLNAADVPVLYHDLFTSGILYLDVGLDLQLLPSELLPLVPLFSRCLLEMGTESESYVQLTNRIGKATGGVRTQTLVATSRRGGEPEAWLVVRAKAFPAHAPALFGILRDILLTARLDDFERFKQMALEERARIEARIPPAGSAYIDQRLRAFFTRADAASEQMGGISYLLYLRDLVGSLEARWTEVADSLQRIRSILLNRRCLVCNVTVDEAGWRTVEPQLTGFCAQIPASDEKRRSWPGPPAPASEAFTIPGQVNYVGKAAEIYALGYREHGSVLAIQNLLNTSWLWDRVRKEGGAYGVGCNLDRNSGILGFTSYRDPNVISTLRAFDACSDFLESAELSEADVERCIIGAIGDLDAYQLPDARGFTSLVRWLLGITDEERQLFRDELLSCGREQFRQFAPVLRAAAERGIIGAVGAEGPLRAALAESAGLFQIRPLL